MSDAKCRVVAAGGSYEGKQGLTYVAGLTGATAGSRGVCLHVVTLPPGRRAKTHFHRGIETAVFVLEGTVDMLWGERLEERLVARAGEYMYVPADVPHRVMNVSASDVRAVVAHTAADDQDGIVLLPELDELSEAVR